MKRKTELLSTQELTGYLEHFLVKTPVAGESLEVTADEESDSENFFKQHRVREQIIEIIRMRANVVIIGPTDGDGVSVAVEAESAADATEIQDSINAMGSVDFGGSTLDLAQVEVLKVDYKLVDPTP